MKFRSLSVLIVLLLLLVYGYMKPPWGYNQATRFDVLHAIFAEGTVAIDAYHDNTGDKVELNGHFYSDKAPGTILVAAPAFAVTKGVLTLAGIDIHSDRGWKISEWVVTTFSVGLLAAVSALSCFALCRRILSPQLALVVVLAIYMGSITFTYANMLFSHTATMALLMIALWAVDVSVGIVGPSRSSSRNYLLLAGFCLGLSIACEFTSAIVAGAVLLYVLASSRRAGVIVMLASCVPLLLIPLNNWLITGSLVQLPYEHVTNFPGMQQGFFGVQAMPNLSNAFTLLVSQYRGLFFWTPFLLLCLPGFRTVRSHHKSLLLLLGLAPVLHMLLISSYPYWHGGWALGPRHFAAIIPCLTIVSAWGLLQLPRLGVALAGLSIALSGGATILDPLAPEGKKLPLSEHYLPIIQEGNIRENLGTVLGLEGWMSLVPLALIVAVLLYLLRSMLRNMLRNNAS